MSAVEEKPAAAPAEQQQAPEKPAEEAKATDAAPESGAAKPETETANGESEATKTDDKKAAEGEAKEDDKSTKPRLVGAARNRFRWFVRNGYGKDEAAELAKDPEKIKEIKEQRELNGNGKRPANGSGNGPASKQARIASGPIRMVVSTENHPGTKLTTEQVNQIKTAILKQVVLQKDSVDVKPHFADCSFVDGYLLVQCSDGPTVEWLQQVVPKLELWKDASVRVASEKSLQRSDIYIAVFSDSLQDSDKDILSFVESQNDGFDTSKWAILGRKEITAKKEVELILTLDIASGKQVSKQNFELNYKFSKVTLKKKKRIAGPPPSQNANNNNSNNNNRGNRANGGGGGQGARRIYNAASSFVPIWDNNLPNFNRNNNNNRNAGNGGFNANRGGQGGPRQNDSNFRNQQRSNNGNGFGLGGGNGPRGNQRNNPRPRSLIDQLMQTVNSANGNGNGQGRRPNNSSFNGGNNMQSGGGRPNRGQNNRNQSRARPGFF